jgi:hypothetical protein
MIFGIIRKMNKWVRDYRTPYESQIVFPPLYRILHLPSVSISEVRDNSTIRQNRIVPQMCIGKRDVSVDLVSVAL